MGNRALQLATVLVAVVLGVGAAYGVREVRNVSTKQAVSTPTPSPSPSPSPLAVDSPSPSSSPAESPSPSASPSPAPSAAPGSAPYPAQLQAGTTYQYNGTGILAALATDSADNGSSVCAGINNTSQTIPDGYIGAYFVSVTFRDGQVLSSGVLRIDGSTSHDFGQLQNPSGKKGNQDSGATPDGTRTYCITRGSGGWDMTSSGSPVPTYSTNAETATTFAGATITFESTIQRRGDSSSPITSLTFVVPGFSNLAIDGKPPTQLKGRTA
jgi:hypothetical protein